MRYDRRSGFTLIELLMVVLIISILAALAQPKLRGVLIKARATEIMGDLDVVRLALENFHADNSRWPEGAGIGIVPAELSPHLPDGYSFDFERHDLGLTSIVFGSITIVYLDVYLDEPNLGPPLKDLLGADGFLSGLTRVIWIVELNF